MVIMRWLSATGEQSLTHTRGGNKVVIQDSGDITTVPVGLRSEILKWLSYKPPTGIPPFDRALEMGIYLEQYGGRIIMHTPPKGNKKTRGRQPIDE